MSAEDDFDEFYRAHVPGLCRALYVGFGDLALAEECTQEAFVRAWQRWNRLDLQPVAWTRRVAWNLAIDQLRKDGRRSRREERVSSPNVTSDQSVSEAMAVLHPLSAEHRAVMVLHYLEDLSVADVGQTLGVSSGTVKSRLSRARELLRSGHSEGEGHE